MSARDELYNIGVDDMPVTGPEVDKAIDAFAHELAKKIRTELAERVTQRITGLGTISTHYSAQHAADLIDPEADKPLED